MKPDAGFLHQAVNVLHMAAIGKEARGAKVDAQDFKRSSKLRPLHRVCSNYQKKIGDNKRKKSATKRHEGSRSDPRKAKRACNVSSDSGAPSSAGLAGGHVARPSRFRWIRSLKYCLLVAAVAGPYVSAFLVYPLPELSDSLYDLSWLCWFIIVFISLGVLLLRRWIAVGVFAAAWIWLFFGPSYGPNETRYWLIKLGFRFHAFPVEDYLSRCKLVEFTENDSRQTVGFCEGTGMMSPVDDLVYYDSTGEFGLPPSQRTPQWNQAMSQLAREEVIERTAWSLFGNFYRVEMPLEKYRG